MPYNPNLHHRRSIRLRGYDYSQAGAYFVTLCVHQRQCLLGEIVDAAMVLNDYGHLVEREWLKSSEIRTEIVLDEFVVMPNHLHAIVCLIPEHPPIVGAKGPSPLLHDPTPNIPEPRMKPRSLGSLIGGFKSSVTKQINELRQTPYAPFWQRNYYEHIIRDENDLDRIREYILLNPAKWGEDDENPDRLEISL